MGATSKLAAIAARHDAKHHAKLTERHRGILAAGETIRATLRAFSPETPQPNMWFTSGLGGLVGYFIGNAVDRPKARARSAAIQASTGAAYTQFPESKNGYRIAITELRVLVFDGKAKELVSEGPISAMNVSSLDHSSELSSVIFSNGDEHIAVTSARGHGRAVEVFVASFPRTSRSAPQQVMAASGAGSTGVVEF